MKQSRFSEEQIIGILRDQETEIAVAELCRKHGVSSLTFYKWKANRWMSQAMSLTQLADQRVAPRQVVLAVGVADPNNWECMVKCILEIIKPRVSRSASAHCSEAGA